MKHNYTSRIEAVKPSATLSIVAKTRQLRADGADIIALGVGEPDFNTPSHIIDAGIRAMQEGKTRYTAAVGVLPLREAIVEKLKRDNGIDCSVDNIIVSAGAKHSLFNLLYTHIEEGDEVIIFTPYWVSYPEMVRLVGGTPVLVEGYGENDFVPKIEDLENAISDSTKMILLNSPGNPTGKIYPQDFVHQVIQIADNHDITVVSDECYEQIVYDKPFESPGKGISPSRVVTMQSLSKTYAMTGWRLGYLVAEEGAVKQMSKLQSQSTSSINSISQYAAIEALLGTQSFLNEWRSAYRERRDYLVEGLNQIDGITCAMPEGAFYCFPDISSFYNEQIKNSEDMAGYLLEEALVAMVHGAPFGADNHIRLSYATSLEEIKVAVKRIETALMKLK